MAKKMRIFIKGLNWVGDAIIATPALAHLRHSFPEAEITIMVRPWVEPVYRYNPHIDRIWVHNDSKNTREFLAGVRRVRSEHFSLGIAFPNSIRSALLLWLGGVDRRVGFAFGARSWLLNQSVPLDPELLHGHQVFYYLALIESFCGKAKRTALVLNAGEDEREEVRRFLLAKGIDPNKRLIGIAPGSINSNAKRWLPERFAELADRLAHEQRADVLLLGSAAEREVLDRVKAAAKNPAVYNTGGELNLSQAIALTERLEGLVCNDSGAMHIAAALKIPTVAIFGPTQFNATYPYSNRALIVRRQGLECSPCMLRECPIDHPCMTQIPVEAVASAFDRIVNQTRKAAAGAAPTFHEMMVHV